MSAAAASAPGAMRQLLPDLPSGYDLIVVARPLAEQGFQDILGNGQASAQGQSDGQNNEGAGHGFNRFYRKYISPLLGPSCRHPPVQNMPWALENMGSSGFISCSAESCCHPLIRGYDPLGRETIDWNFCEIICRGADLLLCFAGVMVWRNLLWRSDSLPALDETIGLHQGHAKTCPRAKAASGKV